MSTELDTALYEALASMEALLKKEREAIASFDTAALRELSTQKNSYLEELRPTLQRAARQKLATLLAQANANHALLQDALGLVSAALGLSAEATYDSRARVLQRASHRIGRSI